MKTTSRIILAAVFGSFLLPGFLHAEISITELQAQFEELRADLDQPLEEFDQRYEEELLKLKEAAQASGDLDLALAVTEELFNYKKDSSKTSAHDSLKRLQAIYATESERLTRERAEKLIGMLNGYKKRIDDAVAESTKSGNLDAAVEYRQESVRVEKEITELIVANTPPKEEKPESLPSLKKDPEFVAGTYHTNESGYGPTITFKDDGSYQGGFYGDGKWKIKSGDLVLHLST